MSEDSEKIQIIISQDGSHTLYRRDMDETYHSRRGAIAESQYVFIEKGLSAAAETKNEITILEIGFGTGLNAILTLRYAIEEKIVVHYHTLEPFPLREEIFTKLNHLDQLNRNDLYDDFLKMHQSKSGEKIQINNYFEFVKYQQKLEDFKGKSQSVDLIYYDAFAPSKQPEVWVLENLEKCADLITNNGLFVTYCASGQFKRDLKQAGFTVESLPGPLGKKEMTRGTMSARF